MTDHAHPPRTEAVARKLETHHADVVDRVKAAIAQHPVVVVGMAWNQPVRMVRQALDEAGVRYEYVELGNYLGYWRERLAVKLWTGWPTFPQVFVRGTFVGGHELVVEALADGSFRRLLGPEPSTAGSPQPA